MSGCADLSYIKFDETSICSGTAREKIERQSLRKSRKNKDYDGSGNGCFFFKSALFFVLLALFAGVGCQSEQSLPDDMVAVEEADYAPLTGLASGSREAKQNQKESVQKLGLPLEVKSKKTGIPFRLVPAGSYTMGSPSSESGRGDDEKQHWVKLTKPFYCGKFEVTQGQWKQVMGDNPSHFDEAGLDAPVEVVNWEECQKFLDKLCDLEGVPRGTYRLLTEAEWEYACRAGTETRFCFGDNDDELDKFGNYEDTPLYGDKTTAPVGSFRPNAWGLYDMHGNVYEWCSDWYGDYPTALVTEPETLRSGSERVHRGGSWISNAAGCRSASRAKMPSAVRIPLLGLRLLRVTAVNVPQEDDETALMRAVQNGHAGKVRILIDAGADVNAARESGATALTLAARNGYADIAHTLIDAGADVNAVDQNGWTPLIWAAANGHAKTVKTLIDTGADVKATDQNGLTPLMAAAHNGHTDIVRELIKSDADVTGAEEGGETALMMAARNGHGKIVRILIDAGADVNAADQKGWPPLIWAAANGQEKTVKTLINAGADVNAIDQKGPNPLKEAAADGHADIVRILIDAGADVNAAGEWGATALMMAARNGHADTVRTLINIGANVSATDQNGLTPVMAAARNGHADIVQTLIDAGADVNAADQNGWTPLIWAAGNGHAKTVKTLIDAGADVNAAAGKSGRTALTHAMIAGHEEVMEILVDAGAE